MSKLCYVYRPFEGETVYSLLAATARLSPNSRFISNLMSGQVAFARPVWPAGLRSVVEAFPAAAGITAEELMLHHTLVPAFTPLMSESRRSALIRATLELSAGEPSIISGAAAAGLSLAPTLRVCRQCRAQAKGRDGWWCIHQCDGVIVCPDHPGEVLLLTDVRRSPVENRKQLVDVRDAHERGPCATVSPTMRDRALLIASSIASLLNGGCASPGPEQFRLWLRERLRDVGFRAAFGKIAPGDASCAISDWLGSELTSALGLPASRRLDNSNWIIRLLNRRVDAIHPLKAVVACGFLGLPVRSALESAAQFQPSPMRITQPMRRGMPPVYQRFESAKRRLRKLWGNHRLSVSEIGRQMGIRDTTASRWAARLGLPFPRSSTATRICRGLKPRPVRPPFKSRLKEKRTAWLALLKSRATTLSCRHLPARPIYQWLDRYDPVWLDRHPLHARRLPPVDWHRRDIELSGRVRAAAEAIRGRFPPARISRTKIAVMIGAHTLMCEFSTRLPRTSESIRRCVEPHHEFVARRLRALHDAGRLSERSLATALRKRPSLKNHPLLKSLI